MRRTLIALIICTMTLSSLSAQSKKFYKRETALIFYELTIDGGYMQKFEQFEHLFTPSKDSKRHPIKNQMLYTSWDMVREALEQQTGMLIVPMDAYGKRFTYNDYGFPNMTANKAISKGESRYYLRFDINLKPEANPIYSTNAQKPDSLQTMLEPNQIQPVLTIDITIYPNKGVLPVCKATITHKAPQPMELNDELFDGFVNNKVSTTPTTIYGLLHEALLQLGGTIFANLR